MEMTLLAHFNLTTPAQLLIASIWQGMLLTVCVSLALRLAAALHISLRASTRFALWLIAFLSVAALPVLAVLRSAVTHQGLAPAGPAAGVSLQPYWAFALEGLWLIASLFSLTRLLAGGLQTASLLRRSSELAANDLSEELQSVIARPGARSITIRLSDEVDAPSAIGFLRPAVVLPRSLWNELGPDELRQIVLHEMAHLLRHDDWTNLLQKLLRALCPLNPALFWAERHLCRERERACDDAVLDADGNARGYATCLTRLAENKLVRRALALAPGLWRRPSELAGRVDHILHRGRTLGPLLSRGLLAASMLASVAGLVLFQRCPGLVAFADTQQGHARIHAVNGTAPQYLDSAVVTRASFQNNRGDGLPKAGYHDAVFHPSVNQAPALEMKHVVTSTKPHPRRQQLRTGHYRLVALSDGQDQGPTLTFVVFTIQLPSSTRPSQGELPAMVFPEFTFSRSWISFQI